MDNPFNWCPVAMVRHKVKKKQQHDEVKEAKKRTIM